MESLILFLLGISAPFAVALVVMALEERRRNRFRTHLERADQHNRGLRLALSVNGGKSDASLLLPAGADRHEVDELLEKLARNGNLLEWLRLGASSPAAPSARLAGGGQDSALLQQAIAEWGPHGVVAALERLKDRLAAMAEMEMVWADPHAHLANDAGAMLERTMWVFEPEYVVSESRFAVDPRLGAVAKPFVGTSLLPGQNKDGEPTLVVELKNARVTVGADQQLQAWNNVRELMRAGAVRERDPVDVFVIGGAVDELDGNPRIEGRYRNVRITSYDYGQLIARANRLTFGLYDELKDVAPFLRRHREEIAAAQQAAVNQAAAEASAPPQEHVRPADEADTPHHAHYAAAPPRGLPEPEPAQPPQRTSDFEGEHIVIGKRRYAAQ
jgi:hypothetical protein